MKLIKTLKQKAISLFKKEAKAKSDPAPTLVEGDVKVHRYSSFRNAEAKKELLSDFLAFSDQEDATAPHDSLLVMSFYELKAKRYRRFRRQFKRELQALTEKHLAFLSFKSVVGNSNEFDVRTTRGRYRIQLMHPRSPWKNLQAPLPCAVVKQVVKEPRLEMLLQSA